MSTVALQTFAAPLVDLLERNGVSELSVNRPGEVWLEVGDTMERHEIPRLTLDHLKQFARLAAQYTEQLISEEHPLLSGTLPGGYRIQIVYPPAVEPATIALSIRRQIIRDVALDEWARPSSASPKDRGASDDRLQALHAE